MDIPTPATAPQPLLCIVNRHQGYPADSPAHKLGTVIELPDNETTRDDIKKRYLIHATADDPLFTPECAQRVVAYQKHKTELAAKAPQATAQTSAVTTTEDPDEARAKAEAAAKKLDDERRAKVTAIMTGTDGGDTKATVTDPPGGSTPSTTLGQPASTTATGGDDPAPNADAAGSDPSGSAATTRKR